MHIHVSYAYTHSICISYANQRQDHSRFANPPEATRRRRTLNIHLQFEHSSDQHETLATRVPEDLQLSIFPNRFLLNLLFAEFSFSYYFANFASWDILMGCMHSEMIHVRIKHRMAVRNNFGQCFDGC